LKLRLKWKGLKDLRIRQEALATKLRALATKLGAMDKEPRLVLRTLEPRPRLVLRSLARRPRTLTMAAHSTLELMFSMLVLMPTMPSSRVNKETTVVLGNKTLELASEANKTLEVTSEVNNNKILVLMLTLMLILLLMLILTKNN